jgi:hypothetical protein
MLRCGQVFFQLGRGQLAPAGCAARPRTSQYSSIARRSRASILPRWASLASWRRMASRSRWRRLRSAAPSSSRSGLRLVKVGDVVVGDPADVGMLQRHRCAPPAPHSCRAPCANSLRLEAPKDCRARLAAALPSSSSRFTNATTWYSGMPRLRPPPRSRAACPKTRSGGGTSETCDAARPSPALRRSLHAARPRVLIVGVELAGLKAPGVPARARRPREQLDAARAGHVGSHHA